MQRYDACKSVQIYADKSNDQFEASYDDRDRWDFVPTQSRCVAV